MGNELAVVNFDEVSKIAGAMVKSGYFQDAKDVSQAIVKILAGAEIGIGAFQAMNSIYIIQGRPSMSANLMAAKVKGSGRYDYRVIELTEAVCEIAFYQERKEIGRSRFSSEDARKAGTKNLDKYPRNMLFSRAMSNGVRWFCPDVLGAAPVYTPEELGADIAEDDTVIDIKAVEARVVDPTAPQTTQADNVDENAVEVPGMAYETAKDFKTKEGQLYIDIDTPTLSHMANSLNKGIGGNKYTNGHLEEAQQKLAAIRVILQKRSEANVSVK